MVKSERDVSKFYKSAKNVEDAQDGMRLWGDPGTTWQTQGARRKRNDQTLQKCQVKDQKDGSQTLDSSCEAPPLRVQVNSLHQAW